MVRAVLDLLEGLATIGVDVTLLTSSTKDIPTSWKDDAQAPKVITIERKMTPWFTLHKTTQPPILDALANADVLHLHTPWEPLNVPIAAEARRTGTPYLVSAHGMLDDWSMAQHSTKKKFFLWLFGRRMLCGAFAMHFTADAEAEQALRYVPGANAGVLPLLLDLAPYADPPGPEIARQAFPILAGNESKLLFLSRIHHKKGVERLIDTTANLIQQGRKVQTLIAGPGEEDYLSSLKHRAVELGVQQQVHFLGMVRGDTKLSLYNACDVFVLPTSQENFGIVLAEAMACGLPTVTTHGVDIARELERCGAKIVSDQATPGEAELTTAIANLLDTPNQAATAATTRAGVLDWLNPQRVLQDYLALYREACGLKT